jgi:hypothetical protein
MVGILINKELFSRRNLMDQVHGYVHRVVHRFCWTRSIPFQLRSNPNHSLEIQWWRNVPGTVVASGSIIGRSSALGLAVSDQAGGGVDGEPIFGCGRA